MSKTTATAIATATAEAVSRLQVRGTCPCCGRDTAVVEGRLADHGYQLVGWRGAPRERAGSCIAACKGFAPLEVSPEGLVWAVGHMATQVAEARHELATAQRRRMFFCWGAEALVDFKWAASAAERGAARAAASLVSFVEALKGWEPGELRLVDVQKEERDAKAARAAERAAERAAKADAKEAKEAKAKAAQAARVAARAKRDAKRAAAKAKAKAGKKWTAAQSKMGAPLGPRQYGRGPYDREAPLSECGGHALAVAVFPPQGRKGYTAWTGAKLAETAGITEADLRQAAERCRKYGDYPETRDPTGEVEVLEDGTVVLWAERQDAMRIFSKAADDKVEPPGAPRTAKFWPPRFYE